MFPMCDGSDVVVVVLVVVESDVVVGDGRCGGTTDVDDDTNTIMIYRSK